MKALFTGKPGKFEKSPVFKAIAPTHFNVHSVVGNPDFFLTRPVVIKGEITTTVRAHCIGKDQWIAAAAWDSLSG